MRQIFEPSNIHIKKSTGFTTCLTEDRFILFNLKIQVSFVFQCVIITVRFLHNREIISFRWLKTF